MRISDWSSDVCSSDLGEEFRWIRPGAFGGKSLIWGRWSFRWSPGDFEANKREGVAGDWPIRYDDVVPWYNYVEKYIGVSGSRENLSYLPDSEFQPPMPMNIAEKWQMERFDSGFPGRKKLGKSAVRERVCQSVWIP